MLFLVRGPPASMPTAEFRGALPGGKTWGPARGAVWENERAAYAAFRNWAFQKMYDLDVCLMGPW